MLSISVIGGGVKEGMVHDYRFLKLVKSKGGYCSEGEASRAVHSVFGTIKAHLSPAAADVIRQVLPHEAAQLWRFSPVLISSGRLSERMLTSVQSHHFLLKIQQLGEYRSPREALRAADAVLAALGRSLPQDASRFLQRMFPREMIAAIATHRDRAA